MKTIKKGDIILYKAKPKDIVGKVIGFFTGGDFCHAAIVRKTFGVSIELIESQAPNGVQIRIANQDDEVADAVVFQPLNKSIGNGMVSYCMEQIGKHYDLLAFPGTWWRATLNALGLKKYSNSVDPNNDRNAFYCSELIASAYRSVTGNEICNGLAAESVTPNDLYRALCKSNKFKKF